MRTPQSLTLGRRRGRGGSCQDARALRLVSDLVVLGKVHETLPDTLRLPTRVLDSAGAGVRHRERVEKELCGPTGQPRFLIEKSHLSIFGQPSTFLGRDEVFPAQY